MSTETAQNPPAGAIAVIGGSGFIGSRLVELLVNDGREVRIGDVRYSEAFPKIWAECDVRKLDAQNTALQGAETIVNLAAEHRDDVRPISRYHEVNVEGAVHVCRVARELDVMRIVFTSSVAVYGFQPRPVGEDGPFHPFNAYGKTKLEAEAVYRAWAAEDPARSLVIVRPTVVFGEGNRGNVYNLLNQIARERFMMVGSGANVKSIAYVGNVAAFLAYAINMSSGTHTYNYVDTPDMDTRSLISYARECLGKTKPLPHVPKRLAMTGGYILDGISRVTNRTFPISAIRVRKFCETTQFLAERLQRSDFSPPYSLREGLARTIRFDFPVT